MIFKKAAILKKDKKCRTSKLYIHINSNENILNLTYFAVCALISRCASARVRINSINALRTVQTWIGRALVYVCKYMLQKLFLNKHFGSLVCSQHVIIIFKMKNKIIYMYCINISWRFSINCVHNGIVLPYLFSLFVMLSTVARCDILMFIFNKTFADHLFSLYLDLILTLVLVY